MLRLQGKGVIWSTPVHMYAIHDTDFLFSILSLLQLNIVKLKHNAYNKLPPNTNNGQIGLGTLSSFFCSFRLYMEITKFST